MEFRHSFKLKTSDKYVMTVGQLCKLRHMSNLSLQPGPLQSISLMRDCVILKFEARIQIYIAVLNFGCEIQNSGGNAISFSKTDISVKYHFY